MLSRTSDEDASGRPGATIVHPPWRNRLLALGIVSIAAPIVAGLAITALTGSLFGVWGWAEIALILLLAETVVLLTLGMYRGEHNPYRSIVPGANHWATHANDPLVLYAGTLRPPVAADARVSSDARPLRMAVAPAFGVLVMLGIVIAGSANNAGAGPPSPETLPIVAVDNGLSLMLETVDLQPAMMTLTFRIDDLEYGRSTAGYEYPRAEDLILSGLRLEQPGVSAGFEAIRRTDKPGFNEITAWRLYLYLAPPSDPAQPVIVGFDTLRFVPNRNIPNLPERVDGEWSFTFIPAAP